MLRRLLPREEDFFGLFEQHAALTVEGAREMQRLLGGGQNARVLAARIKEIEHETDVITHACVEKLHKTFITPFDRDDIHTLITRMDDILDLTEDVAQSVYLYDLQTITPEAKKLAEICVTCSEKVRDAIGLLPNMENAPKIRVVCTEIDRLESEADHVMRAAMAKLFRDEPDVRQVIKLKAIYELLESVTDRCEDVANVIEGIVVENA